MFCLGNCYLGFPAYSLEGILSDLLKDLGLDRYCLELRATAERFFSDSSNVLADGYLLKLLVVLKCLVGDLGHLVLDLVVLDRGRD